MKIIIAILIAFTVFVIQPLAVVQGKTVTSDKLSISDITKANNSGNLRTMAANLSNVSPESIKVLGIHQENNTADAYYEYTLKVGSQEKKVVKRINLIRFNSGKWFIPGQDKHLEY